MITDELREELNQVAASNGQVYANLKGLSSNEDVANNAMLGCSLEEINEKLDRHNKNGAASGAEKDEGQLSSKVLVMQPILRFLQLLCENHNRELQVMLKPFLPLLYPTQCMFFYCFFRSLKCNIFIH